jgi:hypothetical protein
VLAIAPGLVAALGATLSAAPIGAAALGSEAAEAPTEGEGGALSRGRCAKAADTNAVAIIAVITSTRSSRLKTSFPFSFSEAPGPLVTSSVYMSGDELECTLSSELRVVAKLSIA